MSRTKMHQPSPVRPSQVSPVATSSTFQEAQGAGFTSSRGTGLALQRHRGIFNRHVAAAFVDVSQRHCMFDLLQAGHLLFVMLVMLHVCWRLIGLGRKMWTARGRVVFLVCKVYSRWIAGGGMALFGIRQHIELLSCTGLAAPTWAYRP